ncbi:hypothetical protein GIB67_030766 [Kingdonia uniflora]|uniref:Pentatricopeptide repeat-containing protein n=1 Tax=Kingdonia uniflora TaxID=39325 RepID=A0A7J7L356_9MAGN|nr:hypothetical protein GIB67_030766 [Kingdonia uniflora]
MRKTEVNPDNYTFACVLRACMEKSDSRGLRVVHGGVVVSGLEPDMTTSSALVNAYAKLGQVEEACNVFNKIAQPDLVLCNSMVTAYGHGGFWDKSLEMFREMLKMGIHIDGYTLVGLLSGFADPSLLEICQGIHGLCLKAGFDYNGYVGSSLVSMYSRCGCLYSGYRVFSSLSQVDLVIWSSLITGFSQSRDYEMAMLLFKEMNMKGVKGDAILTASVLAACAKFVVVQPGKEIHGYVFRHGLVLNVMVTSALIDMYSKCGFAHLGLRVFETASEKSVVVYNSVITGLGSHGLASQAFGIFEEMLFKRLIPDQCTFSALLNTCSHAELVKEGCDLFKRMEVEFGIAARTEHYVYMVKLLGMAGELGKAYDLIQKMPNPPDSGVLGALLSCCVVHGNLELGKIVSSQLSQLEPEKTAYGVMLSNICANDGKWDDVRKLRDDMVGIGLKKSPGLSRVGDGNVPYSNCNRDI